MRKLKSATLRPALEIVPLPGFFLTTCGPGEYLVINETDSTNNVIVDADTVMSVLLDYARGGPLEDFSRGHGTMWRFGDEL